ncbi:MAG TPA: nucleotide sugar dehydrogenase [Candidatus Limnocylindrales bacterium]|nr:nucleotide sugar dehydrogenase [Candidatus Limnocylindrales bacterium]
MAVQVRPFAPERVPAEASVDSLLAPLFPVIAPRPKVAILGLGYVGLPTALALLEAGTDVIGVDVSAERLASIRARQVDLSPLDQARLARQLRGRRLLLSRRPAAIAAADAVIVAVPTPVDEHLVPDLEILEAACRSVVAEARPGQTLILTSTSYVGCTRDLLVRPLEERGLRVGVDVFVAFSPERIDPGNRDFPQERVPRVVGGVTAECLRRATQVVGTVAPFTHPVSSPEVAELTKLHENIFRAVNIALANEMADVARQMDVDITEVIDAAATKPYGFMRFSPGPGVGGHCIPCDPHYLLWQLRRERLEAPLVERAMSAIASRPGRVVERAAEVLAARRQTLRGARVLVLGVAYKPHVEDVRESPAVEIIRRLNDAGAEVAFADPLVSRLRIDGRDLCADPAPEQRVFDLVIVHTVEASANLGWLADQPAVLDASFAVPRSLGAESL